jgi:hypothetical protein
MSTLSITASITRTDTVKSVTVEELAESVSVSNDEVSTIVIESLGSYNPQFNSSTAGSFLSISSDCQLSISINNTSGIKGKSLHISDAEITSLGLENLSSSSAATVRLIIGG